LRATECGFFTAYRRVQTDQTFNNTVVPVERRGNLWFAKVTTQTADRAPAAGQPAVRPHGAGQRDLSRHGGAQSQPRPVDQLDDRRAGSATPQITAASALGTLVKGGPLASFNYNWVVSSSKVFQFVGSFMINKPNDLQPNQGQSLTPTKIIQSNPTGNILGSLTTWRSRAASAPPTRRIAR
jgi:hypothetical protein